MQQSTLQKSQEQAHIILCIGTWAKELDLEYLRNAAKELKGKASLQDSAGILSSRYTPEKSDLTRLQANAIDKICDYVDALKAIDEAKLDISERERGQEKLNRILGF